MAELILSSAAATWLYTNNLVFPICAARRSVGVGRPAREAWYWVMVEETLLEAAETVEVTESEAFWRRVGSEVDGAETS
jgi:hypothetical protein